MTDTFVRTGILGLLLAVAACRSPASLGPAPVPAPLVQLVDSVAIDEGDGGTLRRVEVRHGARVDTLAGVLTFELPLLVGGSRLLGFDYGGDVARVFEYDLGTHTVRRDSLPGDFHPAFSAGAFSPDGRHIAYVVIPGDATGYAVARTWPGLELVWRSATVEVPATDAEGGNQVRWLSPDTAEVLVETGYATDTAWYRVVGSIGRRAVISADTVRERPRW
jgi:hypothetical protein